MNEILFSRNIFHFFTHIKTDLIFYLFITRQIWSFTNQIPFFSQFSKNRSDIFSNQKIWFSLISTNLNFSLQKANFFQVLKNRFDFSKPNSIFLQHKSDFFFFHKTNLIFYKSKSIFFQIKSWSTLSLDVDLSFFNIVDFETKKGSWIVVFVMFVIFSTYSINLFYEWNPLFKKSFSFFYTYKNKSDFF